MTVLNVFCCWAWLCPYCEWCFLGACVDSPNGEAWDPVLEHLEGYHPGTQPSPTVPWAGEFRPFFWPTWSGTSGYWRIRNPIR